LKFLLEITQQSRGADPLNQKNGAKHLSNNQTRNQYKIKLIHFHEVKDVFDQICVDDTTKIITVSDSIYLDQLQKVVAKHDSLADFTDAIFMVKADNIDQDDPSQIALFKRILREGIYYKNEKYVRSIKSPAMGRTQRTEFIKEKYLSEVYNRIALGHCPSLTNINKWEAALGVSRSTASPVPYIPRIVVIPDYKKNEIIEDVWKVEEYEKDTEQQKLVISEKEKQRQYFKAMKDLKPSQEYLSSLERIPNKSIQLHAGIKLVPDQSNSKHLMAGIKRIAELK